jgi:hypothetical protein
MWPRHIQSGRPTPPPMAHQPPSSVRQADSKTNPLARHITPLPRPPTLDTASRMRFGGRRRGAVTAVAVECLRLDAETRDRRPVNSGRLGGGRRGAPRPVSVRPAAGSLGWSAACRRPAQAVRQAARSRLDLPTWSPPWTAGPQTNTPTPLQQIGEHRAPPLKIHSMSIVSS